MPVEELLQLIPQYGAPTVFIIGLFQGWWYLKPHVALEIKEKERAVTQMDIAQRNQDRAFDLADEAHRIAKQALELQKEQGHTADVRFDALNATIHDLSLEIARMQGVYRSENQGRSL